MLLWRPKGDLLSHTGVCKGGPACRQAGGLRLPLCFPRSLCAPFCLLCTNSPAVVAVRQGEAHPIHWLPSRGEQDAGCRATGLMTGHCCGLSCSCQRCRWLCVFSASGSQPAAEAPPESEPAMKPAVPPGPAPCCRAGRPRLPGRLRPGACLCVPGHDGRGLHAEPDQLGGKYACMYAYMPPTR